MVIQISESVQLIVEFIMIMLVTQYVFLVKKQKKQNLYNIFAIAIVEITYWCAGVNAAISVLSFVCGLNIVLSRETHRFRGFFMMFPITGLVDGLALPLVILPAQLAGMEENALYTYQLIIYGALLLLYFAFLLFGKGWRKQFILELEGRSLLGWEKAFLSVVGMILLILSSILSLPIKEIAIGDVAVVSVYLLLGLLGIVAFIMTLAVIIVVMVGNKQSYYHSKVSDMQFNIIVMMAEIVENRDKNTGGHIKRTATYVEIIARQLKKMGKFKEELTDTYIKDMIVAAPLHDIGKIHVSDVILNKNGRLTDEEFKIMQTHAVEGRNLLVHAKEHLGEFSYLDIAVEMAGSHHEWWDGSAKGYPDGLKGEEIPLCARIMAVADVFDALISKRCYKEAMPLTKAYDIIREETGTHFDPEIVDAFFAASNKVEAALAKFQEEEELMGDADLNCLFSHEHSA